MKRRNLAIEPNEDTNLEKIKNEQQEQIIYCEKTDYVSMIQADQIICMLPDGEIAFTCVSPCFYLISSDSALAYTNDRR